MEIPKWPETKWASSMWAGVKFTWPTERQVNTDIRDRI